MLWISDEWKEYEVLDATNGERLERWGKYTLVRPDPQVIWNNPIKKKHLADAVYKRSSKGGGSWDFKKDLPEYIVGDELKLRNFYIVTEEEATSVGYVEAEE